MSPPNGAGHFRIEKRSRIGSKVVPVWYNINPKRVVPQACEFPALNLFSRRTISDD
jgi:hypothetical protein